MRKWFEAILKIIFGAFFALTSVYCLLTFLPYTYYAMIKSPAYAWIPWFARHHALLFWLAWLAAAVAYYSRTKRTAYYVCFGILACVGIFLSARPFLAGLESNRTAYFGSVAALWVIILVVSHCEFHKTTATENMAFRDFHLSYVTGSWLAVGIALLSMAGAELRSYSDTRTLSLHVSDIYLTFWSLVSHVFVAIILVSILNLIRIAASKSSHPHGVGSGLLGLLIFGSLWALAIRFLENALSFDGWLAHSYAASLAAALTLLGFSVAHPFLQSDRSEIHAGSARRAIPLVIIATLFAVIALALPTFVGGGDWNGFIQGTFTLI